VIVNPSFITLSDGSVPGGRRRDRPRPAGRSAPDAGGIAPDRFNVRVAVRLDIGAVRNAVDPGLYREAEELLASGRLGGVTAVGGGAACTVHNGSGPLHEVWVGVVSGDFAAECDCAAAGADADELCVHAVAVTLGALADGFAWSSAATPPSGAVVDPKVRRLAEVAATLPARRLAMLVAEHAATDRRLETRLLTYAGQLGPLTDAELAAARKTIDSLAGEATAGQWDLHHVAEAGQWIVDELQVLAERVPSDGALLVIEHAARLWDELAAHLYGAWETYETEPEEIGGALRAVHVRMCEELRPDPEELIDRLNEIIDAAEVSSCLDNPEEYFALLGADGVAAVRRA
jgi:hypothetical protein